MRGNKVDTFGLGQSTKYVFYLNLYGRSKNSICKSFRIKKSEVFKMLNRYSAVSLVITILMETPRADI